MSGPPRWFSTLHRCLAVAFLVLTILAIAGLQYLDFDDDLKTLFKGKSEEFEQFQNLVANFGAADDQCLIVLSGADIRNRETLIAIGKIEKELHQWDCMNPDSIVSVRALHRPQRIGRLFLSVVPPNDDASNEQWDVARQDIENHPLGPGYLYSSDFLTTLIAFQFNDEIVGKHFDRSRVSDAVQQMKEVLQKYWDTTNRASGITGLPIIRCEVTRSLQRDQTKFTILGLIFATIVGGVLFRRPIPILLVAIVPFTGLGWTMGLLGWLGIPLTIMSNVITPLVLVIGFAEAVHVLFVTGGKIEIGLPPWQATLEAIKQLFVPCSLAAATTLIGFGSLGLANDRALQTFAIVASGASVLMFLIVLLGTGCLLASPLGKYCGRKANIRPTHRKPTTEYRIGRHARSTSLLAIILVILAGIVAFQNGPDYRFSENLPESNLAVKALRKIDSKLGGSSPVHVITRFHPRPTATQLVTVLSALRTRLESIKGTSKTSSLLNLLESMPNPERGLEHQLKEMRTMPRSVRDPFLISAPIRTNTRLHLPDIGSAQLKPVIEEIRHQLRQLETDFPVATCHLTGLNVLAVARSEKMITDLVTSLLAASLVIFGLILVVYRSLPFGLAAIIANAFPILGVAAIMSFNGQPIQYTSIMLLCTCLGLAVDDTVHFLSKTRQLQKAGWDLPAAIEASVSHLRPIFTTTSAMLGVGFGLAATSDIPTFQTFGGYACLALILALIGDLIFLPALLFVFAGIPLKDETVAHRDAS
ncbi:MMPL family transporter [Pirellulaceae bacterium]|nr:MMPL family transporter [Pirellulaceae bacterium]